MVYTLSDIYLNSFFRRAFRNYENYANSLYFQIKNIFNIEIIVTARRKLICAIPHVHSDLFLAVRFRRSSFVRAYNNWVHSLNMLLFLNIDILIGYTESIEFVKPESCQIYFFTLKTLLNVLFWLCFDYIFERS